jgi:hypothetical protein
MRPRPALSAKAPYLYFQPLETFFPMAEKNHVVKALN